MNNILLGPVNTELLVEIERLWVQVEDFYMGKADMLYLSLKINNYTLREQTVSSKEEGLVWLSNEYQRLEAEMLGEV